VIAALAAWHEQHAAAGEALLRVKMLPAHVMLEAYSVLTRLPSGLAVPPAAAASVLRTRFPEPVLRLGTDQHDTIMRLSAAGVFGGSSYDGLVALQAHAHRQTVLTLDRRAQETYRRLGIPFQLIGA
jgi:hypothetical protein